MDGKSTVQPIHTIKQFLHNGTMKQDDITSPALIDAMQTGNIRADAVVFRGPNRRLDMVAAMTLAHESDMNNFLPTSVVGICNLVRVLSATLPQTGADEKAQDSRK